MNYFFLRINLLSYPNDGQRTKYALFNIIEHYTGAECYTHPLHLYCALDIWDMFRTSAKFRLNFKTQLLLLTI
jgi:hypothetical protein